MAAIERESGANRALVAYYFGGKAGLWPRSSTACSRTPSRPGRGDPDGACRGAERTERFLDWQQRVSANDRVNRMLFELLPHALRDPDVRARFAEEYREYREIDADCLGTAPARA